MEGIPPARESDNEDVIWALETAESLWKRNARVDAIVWLRRAAQEAAEAGDDDRASSLMVEASALTEALARSSSHTRVAAPVTSPPPPDVDVDSLLADGSDDDAPLRSGPGDDADNAGGDVDGLLGAAVDALADAGETPSMPPLPRAAPLVLSGDDETGEFLDEADLLSLPPPTPVPTGEAELEMEAEVTPDAGEVSGPVAPKAQFPTLPRMLSGPTPFPVSSGMVAPPTPFPIPAGASRARSGPTPFPPGPDSFAPPTPLPLAPRAFAPPTPFPPGADSFAPPTPLPVAPRAFAPPTPFPASSGLPAQPTPLPAGPRALAPPTPTSVAPRALAPPTIPPAEQDEAVLSYGAAEVARLGITEMGPGALSALDLASVPALAEATEAQREELVATARVVLCSAGATLPSIGLALVLEGEVAATLGEGGAPIAHVGAGGALSTRGTRARAASVCFEVTADDTTVALWSEVLFGAFCSESPAIAAAVAREGDRLLAWGRLASSALASRLHEDVRLRLFSRFTARALPAGGELVKAGEPVPGILIVADGSVAVDAPRAEVIEVGGFLFAQATMSAGRAPATARAGAGGAIVLVADRRTTQELWATEPLLLELLASS